MPVTIQFYCLLTNLEAPAFGGPIISKIVRKLEAKSVFFKPQRKIRSSITKDPHIFKEFSRTTPFSGIPLNKCESLLYIFFFDRLAISKGKNFLFTNLIVYNLAIAVL